LARQREFDEDKVLDALRDVFWKHGYEGTSYANIMQATGLQKGSLYAAFGDKRSLYQRAIARYDAIEVDAGVKMLRDETMSGHMRLENLFQTTIDAAETPRGRWGCLLCNAAIDQAPQDSNTEASVKASMNRMREAIKVALSRTNRPNDVDGILAAYFGARVLVKAGMTKAVLQSAAAAALRGL